MNRQQMIDELAQRRLDSKKNVTNPSRLLEMIKNDFADMSDDEIQSDYDRVTGATKKRSSVGSEDYQVSTLDHALTDAVTMITRLDDNGQRTFTDLVAADLLLLDYEPAIAGRALSLATDGSYKIDLGHNARRLTTQAAQAWTPITLAEYKAQGEQALEAS